MITEQKMWERLKEHVVVPDLLTRIECETALGISDVEYVLGSYHGWLELKVARNLREDSVISFGHEFTVHQYSWLVSHHRPGNFLRSWLVIGRHSKGNSVDEWVLVPAPSSASLIYRQLTMAQLRQRPGVVSCPDSLEVIRLLMKGD